MKTLEQYGIGSSYTYPSSTGCFNYMTRAGIELELEGMSLDHRVSMWDTTRDGSLRGGGVEFVTRGGFAGEDLETALQNLTDDLQRNSHRISERCSTHIHIDVRDMTPEQVVNFLCLGVMLEHVLFNLYGNTRTANTFCLPTDCGTNNYDYIVKALVNPETSLLHGSWSKYAAIGLKRIIDLGTVEFRMFKAFTQMSQFTQVLNVLFAMKRMAKDMDSPSNLVDFKLQHGTAEIIQIYMPDVAYAPEFDALLERGIQTLNDIITTAEVIQIVQESTRKFDTIIQEARRQRSAISRGV